MGHLAFEVKLSICMLFVVRLRRGEQVKSAGAARMSMLLERWTLHLWLKAQSVLFAWLKTLSCCLVVALGLD